MDLSLVQISVVACGMEMGLTTFGVNLVYSKLCALICFVVKFPTILKGYSTCGLLNYKEKKVSNEQQWLKSREQNYGWKKSNCNFCLIVQGVQGEGFQDVKHYNNL
jgi:hypothetical protein